MKNPKFYVYHVIGKSYKGLKDSYTRRREKTSFTVQLFTKYNLVVRGAEFAGQENDGQKCRGGKYRTGK